ncbi:hypothetical protein DH86_00001446 [Scytalidium sp. 3C]|nr:hypothetical protein DH86_00001446 [Scytalidium sp. 3C]
MANIHKAGTNDGWHGVISEEGPFPPAANRYHLYIGLFCPFAHRVNLVRHILGLTDIIPISVVMPYPKGDDKGWPGWRFPKSNEEYSGATVDNLFNSSYLHEVYFKADSEYKGRYSVPLLWDTVSGTAVNNESAEMLRWLPTAFKSVVPQNKNINLYPADLASQIDEISAWMQPELNAGVYRAGFAKSQEDYDAAVPIVFRALNKLEALISNNGGPFILGKQLTEVDLRAYATIVRFDTIYVQHFKCNLGTIRHDYPNLYWNVPGFRESTDFKHIKENYSKSHGDINPLAITPMGPIPNVESGVEEDVKKLRVGFIDI